MANIVLIHGAGHSAAVWERQTVAFSEWGHEVAAVDLPGHGTRIGEEGLDSHEKNATELCRMMDQRRMHQAVLVGHSMGGAVALTMALSYPERVQALVLVATGARLRMHLDFLEQARQMAEKYGKAELPGSIIPVEQIVHPSMPPHVTQWLKERTGRASARAAYADFQATNNFDVMNRLAEIHAPALVIGGSDDRMTPRKYSEFLANGIPGAQLEILSPSGHCPMVEQEAQFNKIFDAFLSKLMRVAV